MMKRGTLHDRMRLTKIVVVIVSLIVSLIPTSIANAAELPNKLFIAPSSSQMNIGTSFSVNVRSYADADQTSGSTAGTVTYPAGQLKVTAISVSGSAYGSPTISQGSGTIGFSGARSPAPGGAAQIFAITFQAIGAGTATVGFSGNSHVNNMGTGFESGVYTITDPKPPAASPPKSAPKASVTPKPSVAPVVSTPAPTPATPQQEPEPQPTPDPTGLIDGVIVTPLYSSATITWKVAADNATSQLTYGSSAAQLDKSVSPTKKPDGTFEAKLSGLTPGIRYYFSVSGNGGGKTGNYSGTVLTRGYPIVMTITENNIPVKSAQVKIGNRSYPVSSGGKLSIGLASGSYSGTITTDTATLAINLTVKDMTIPANGDAPPSQNFPFNLTSSVLEQGPGSGSSVLGFIGVLIGGTALLAIGFMAFMAYRRRRYEAGFASNPTATVIVEDGYDWRSDTPDSSGAQTPSLPEQPLSYPTSEQPPLHNNSVHLTEEEPPDMFDRAASISIPLPGSVHAIEPRPNDATEQSPNLPHSTTP